MSDVKKDCMVVVLVESRADESLAVRGIEGGLAHAPSQQFRGLTTADIVALGASRTGRKDPAVDEATKALAAGKQPSPVLLAKLIKAFVQDLLAGTKSREKISASQKKRSTKRTKSNKSESKKDLPKPKKEVDSNIFIRPGTKLERRITGWDDVKEVIDPSHDVNKLFVVITGLHEPQLLVNMALEEVPFHCFVKICLENDQDLDNGSSSISEDNDNILKYWKTFHQLLQVNDNIVLMKDVAFVEFRPNISIRKLNDPAQKFHTQRTIFNEFVDLMYYISDSRYQHKHYVDNIIVTAVEEVPVLNLGNMHFYNSLVNKVLPECVDVPYLLDCMLKQVEQMLSEEAQNSETKDTVTGGIDSSLESAIQILNNEYDIVMKSPIADELQTSMTVLSEEEVSNKYSEANAQVKLSDIHKTNLVCLFQAWVEMATVINDNESETPMQSLFQDMSCSLLNTLLQENACSQPKQYIKYLPIVSSDVSDLSIYSINSNYLNNNGSLIAKQLKCKLFRLDGLSTIYSDDKWPESCISAEIMNAGTALKEILTSIWDFNCMDIRNSNLRKILCVRFHSNYNQKPVYSQKYHVYLRTPIYFRDFYEFVLDYESNWFEEEEKKLKETLKGKTVLNSEGLKIISEMGTESFLNGIAQRLILINSLKYQKMLNLDSARNADIVPLSENKKVSKTKKKSKKDKSTGSDTGKSKASVKKASKKTSKKTSDSSKKALTFSTEPPVSLNEIKNESLLQGYNLGPMRVQLSGHVTSFSSPSGGSVYVDTKMWAHQSKTIRLKISAQGHSLLFHHISKSSVPINNFHINTRLGVCIAFERKANISSHISISKQPEEEEEQVPNTKKKINEPKKSVPKTAQKGSRVSYPETDTNNPSEIKLPKTQKETHELSGYRTKMSLPSGLVIETVELYHLHHYIKQQYININERNKCKENYRCFLANGNVLKFMNDGTIFVLCPDSTVFECFPINSEPVQKIVTIQDEEKRESVKQKGRKKIIEKKGGSKSSSRKSLQEVAEAIIETNYSSEKEKFMQAFKCCVLTADGKHFTLNNSNASERLPDEFIRTITNHVTGEILKRRLDGSTLLLKPDGTLITTFPDDTIITTHVGESEIEFSYDFEDIIYCSTYIMLDTTTTMEHPLYARVKSSMHDLNVEMPDDTHVKILRNGICTVSMKHELLVKIENEAVRFIHKTDKQEHFVSIIYMNAWKEDSSFVLSHTTDIYGNEFEVKCDGTTTSSIQTEGFNTCRCFTIANDMTVTELLPAAAVDLHIENIMNKTDFSVFLEPISLTPYHYYIATLQIISDKRPWDMIYERDMVFLHRKNKTDEKKSKNNLPPWLQPAKKLKTSSKTDFLLKSNPKQKIIFLLKVLFQLSNAEVKSKEPTKSCDCFTFTLDNCKVHLFSDIIQNHVNLFLEGKFPHLGEFLQGITHDLKKEILQPESLKNCFTLKNQTTKLERKLKDDKFERYKNILRTREFGRYFDTVPGITFLNINELIDQTVNYSETKNRTKKNCADVLYTIVEEL
ncbi:uncharacterized protein LOC134542999 isoform X2 [Bacillus rossius redtenbacheri]